MIVAAPGGGLLHCLAEERNPDGIRRALLRREYRQRINALDRHGRNAFVVACAHGDERCGDMLLRSGAALLPLSTSGYDADAMDRAVRAAWRCSHRRGVLTAWAWALELRVPAPDVWSPPAWTPLDSRWLRHWHALLPGEHPAQLQALALLLRLPEPPDEG